MKDIHVLVVEDEYDGQQVVSEMLEYMQIHADVADTAEEALKLLRQNSYQAAILDLALPGMDGLELLRTIREDDDLDSLPCIVITAYHSAAVKRDSLKAGANAYLPKPLDDTSFVREIERLVGSNN
jgi:CheY-like chemotaxis protein